VIAVGSRLGPYEVLTPLGAGGMGEVYRARDTRLGREVAVKVLPGNLSADQERVRRFEQEARSASALDHPNIITIYEIGSADSTLYIAMQYVEGKTLRELLASGLLPTKKVLEISVQIAEGLAKAHAAGIVHRDLKPENVMVSKDGFVKILDFGLAKLTAPQQEEQLSELPTAMAETRPGLVMGTVGYMSPEQASGKALDFRSDQFSFGSILYELSTGKRAFQRGTTAETLTAIIREDPEPVGAINPRAPAPLRWIVERCLAKDPDERFGTTRDLARDLASIRDHLSEAVVVSGEAQAAVPPRRGMRLWPFVLVAGLLAASVLVSFSLGRNAGKTEPPFFHRLTWRRGTLVSARFAPDGQTVLYSAAWDGKPPAIYVKRPESPDAVPLELPGADLLAISPSGEMAIQLNPQYAHLGVTRGTLARAALTGGTPREVTENINQADWGPDGGLVVARDVAGKGRLEYPLGKVLYETAGHVSFPRLSPRADLIAFADHPLPSDDRGSIAIIDLHGKKTALSKEFESVQGLAWSPSGGEVWFTATAAGTSHSLWGVTLSGRQRAITRVPGDVVLQDVTRSGRVLLTRGDPRHAIRWLAPGETRERDLSWFGFSHLSDLSPDGKTIVFDEESEPTGSNYAVCLWRMDSPPVRLGEGGGGALSPDGKWVISQLPKPGAPLVLLPTGAGEPKEIDNRGLDIVNSFWFPDGKRILLVGREAGHGLWRLFLQSLDGGRPRPISPEGVTPAIAISPDGNLAAAVAPDQKIVLYPVDGGEPRQVPGAVGGDFPVQWSADGRSLYIRQRPELFSPARIFRLDVKTGERVLWRELFPEDSAGVTGVATLSRRVRLTPDGRSYAYTYHRILSDLYLVEGLN
jgi:predicted Ser/Thr protein kinase